MPVFPTETLHFREYFRPAVWLGFRSPVFPLFLLNLGEESFGQEVLRVEWDIRMSTTSNADQALVRVYNLASNIRNSLYKAWKMNPSKPNVLQLTCSLGWEDNPELVFVGDIWKFIPSEHTGTDIITTIEAGAGLTPLRDTQLLGKAFAENAFTLILEFCVNQLGVPIDPASLKLAQEAAAATPALDWESYVVSGDIAYVLDNIMDTLGLEWKIFQGKFIVLQKGVAGVTDRATAPVIGSNTGLLNWKFEDDENISFVALAHPRVVPGVQIALRDDTNGEPIGALRHRVTNVAFTGSNHGESLMTVKARKAVLT